VRVGEAGGRSVAAAFVAALIALACVLAVPALANAESFQVNSTADETDAVPGDEFCLTASGKCTLRAAIEEANSTAGEDRVSFEREEVFDGQITGTISLGTALPPIVHPIGIEGECVIDNLLRPCVGVDGPGTSEPALTIEGAEAEIFGLAITGAETGIEVVGSPRLRVLSNWLGVRLDGSPGGNGTGILLGPGSENVRIGNEGESNVFANNVGDGLDIHGADNVRVLGGYFGVGPDGTIPAPNGGKDIEIASLAGSGGVGNRIGTQLSPEAAATPACDGGCNVISGAGSSGIDLEGDGGEEAPAASTTIVGNYVGLDRSGAVAVPNSGDGVHVGTAARTVIGGPRASEANRFAGGDSAVLAGPGAANLVVRGNAIGVDASGAPSLAPANGIVVNSEGLPSAAAEAAITGNEIRLQGGVGIDQKGLGGWISGNRVSGASTGISVTGETEEHGNLIQGNRVEGSGASGLLLESSFNEVLGNTVLGSAAAGVLIEGATLPFGFGVSGNVVGGNAAPEENAIAGSGGPAIEISNPENATNEVARNHGAGNGGLFIDLVAADPKTEPKGPNRGIEPPAIAATRFGASGVGAVPGAKIRVFRKASSAAGEVESFLGEASADKNGSWALAYVAPVPAGALVAATQTGPGSGTSELTVVAVPAEAGGGPACPPAGCAGPAASAPAVPQTKIFKGPKGKRLVGATAAFKFKASVEGSTFQCGLDGKRFRKCHSPQIYTGLKPGKHVFEVRAVNAAGAADPTPAKLKFTVLG
jgi:CSLREA domain-containing protein